LLGRFVAITLLLVAALGWLAWRLVQQDRELERQRTRDRLENAADLIAAALQRSIAEVGDTLARAAAGSDSAAQRIAASLADDAVLLVGDGNELRIHPRGRALFYPTPSATQEASAAIFARGDSLEFRARDPAAASQVYRSIAASANSSVKAAALLRLARATRKTNSVRLAAAAYDEMAGLEDAFVNGVPAPVVARTARLALRSESSGAADDARRDAAELHSALHDGRWRMSRAAFEFYDAEVARVLGLDPLPHGDSAVAARVALSEAASSLWTDWRADEPLPSTGARAARAGEHAMLFVWSARGGRVAAIVGGSRFLNDFVLAAAAPVLERQQASLALADADNRHVLGARSPANGGLRVARASVETRLPCLYFPGRAQGCLHLESRRERGNLHHERGRLGPTQPHAVTGLAEELAALVSGRQPHRLLLLAHREGAEQRRDLRHRGFGIGTVDEAHDQQRARRGPGVVSRRLATAFHERAGW
jgi:hypothetical protein